MCIQILNCVGVIGELIVCTPGTRVSWLGVSAPMTAVTRGSAPAGSSPYR